MRNFRIQSAAATTLSCVLGLNFELKLRSGTMQCGCWQAISAGLAGDATRQGCCRLPLMKHAAPSHHAAVMRLKTGNAMRFVGVPV